MAGIKTSSTYHNWIERAKDPSETNELYKFFQEEMEIAKAHHKYTHINNVDSIAKKANDRERLKASTFILTHVYRDEFHTKQQNEVKEESKSQVKIVNDLKQDE